MCTCWLAAATSRCRYEMGPCCQEALHKVPQRVIGKDVARVCWLSALGARRLAMVALLELDVGPDTLSADCKVEGLSGTPSLKQQASSMVV